MSDQGLRPSADITAADWLGPRLRRFGSQVAAVVPDGFPAYVRILHPARGAADQPVRWAEVPTWSGRTMHRLVQFHAITRPPALVPTDPAPWDGQPPPDGNLPAELLRSLCATLAEHTSTAVSCWFCLGTATAGCTAAPRWRSWVAAALSPSHWRCLPRCWTDPASVSRAGTTCCSPVRWPQRPTSAGPAPRQLLPQSPNLFWPQDHAWCVAAEIDLFCTLVAGPEALAQALVADPRLEAWRVHPADPIAFDSDQINT